MAVADAVRNAAKKRRDESNAQVANTEELRTLQHCIGKTHALSTSGVSAGAMAAQDDKRQSEDAVRASDTALHVSEAAQRAVIRRRKRYHHGGGVGTSTWREPRVEQNMNTNKLRGCRLRPRSCSAVQECARSL